MVSRSRIDARADGDVSGVLAGQLVTAGTSTTPHNASAASHWYHRRLHGDGHPWEPIFENWESEFLQMAMFVLLTTWLVQKGSPESRRPGVRNSWTPIRVTSPMTRAPWPVRRGGWILRLYEHSLGLAFILLFLLSWVGHALGGFSDYAADEVLHRQPEPTSPITSPRRVSGSSRFRTGRANSSPSRRWCGSPSTCDNDGRRNPNRCTHRIPKRDVENLR